MLTANGLYERNVMKDIITRACPVASYAMNVISTKKKLEESDVLINITIREKGMRRI